ncbi:ImmA/IrrE family metallo-endopeptidase [Pseudoclavibacter alba]|uniref:ImmA/IrrE family metallo-endopeptidase n=1 Tax=Pseudoclavibacter albus TaxID=272241 RepID=UPI0019D21B4F|nr:ImmA/IrrE family metallo-endopeptidase [Pseudoclavibacter alba]
MPLIKELARDAAESALTDYWDGEFPVDPTKIAWKLGIAVLQGELEDGQSGMIIKPGDKDKPVIVLNTLESAQRRNFTCAHELGHYFERLRNGDNEYSFVESRTAAMDAHEWYANWFAAHLLMPEPEFRRAYDAGHTDTQLAARFGVSTAAVRTRKRNLNLA